MDPQKYHLTGVSASPWYCEPFHFAVLVYPVEWIFEGTLSDFRMRETSPFYYNRNWGREKIVCLQTLFYRREYSEWFVDEPASGFRQLLKSKPELDLFASEGLSLFQNGGMKELCKERNMELADYWAVPLIPAEVGVPQIYKLELGIPQPAEQTLADLLSYTSST